MCLCSEWFEYVLGVRGVYFNLLVSPVFFYMVMIFSHFFGLEDAYSAASALSK